MAAQPSHDGVFSPIPTGLNRIKTRPAKKMRQSADDDSSNESPCCAASNSRSRVKKKHNNKHNTFAHNKRVKFISHKRGFRKGKKIARWFTSSLFKDSDEALGDFPTCNEFSAVDLKMAVKQDLGRRLFKIQKNSSVQQLSPHITLTERLPKGLKSFSHELGPKGGIQSARLRALSFSNLQELFRSLLSRFDAAKEAVDSELIFFSREMMEILQTNVLLTQNDRMSAEELFIVAKKCIEMASSDFRLKCEAIVQDLTERRQKCQAGLLKLMFTRILFILTRCTRLLHFEDSEPVNERSLAKFRESLERIPSVEMNWFVNKELTDSDTDHVLNLMGGAKQEPKKRNHSRLANSIKPDVTVDQKDANLAKKFTCIGKTVTLDPSSDVERFNKIDDKIWRDSLNKEHEECLDDSNTVICRICEELVPSVHLEPHSYICAYADNCVSKHLDMDQRLLKLAELLENLLGSHNSSCHETPKILRERHINASVTLGSYSPRGSEWRTKGIEGMLEDLHVIDTACIEDPHLVNLRSHLGTKLNQHGPPSSNGSMASASSTNSPRAGNFDFFWLDYNNMSQQEDLQQMMDLGDTARCVAETDLSEEGSHELLLAYMQDLQDVLKNSKHKALVVDTFGGRIENLLREKYILACDLLDRINDIGHPESSKSLLDTASQSSATSTPSHKQRTSIDDFDIIKPISRGAYGKVFLARKRATGDLFAIKVLKKLDMLRKNDIERILAERNILITVRNPFVVRFFYSFTSRDNLYLVMEYLNGGDLYSLLQKVGCLEESVARNYIAELVLALEYLHSLGIVHRDLKPDNILIAQDGHTKLTDFGLSKIGLMNCTSDLSGLEYEKLDVLDKNSQFNVDSEDNQRSAVGTPDYLAPEILLGTKHGYAADWWSVGIILFEFIAGIPPFMSEHPEIIFDNILNRKIPWPSVPDEMSSAAQDLIDRLLVHDPNKRLGAKGASEVKAHLFFAGVDWDNLALQKAVFIPQTDSIDDTSYFVSRYNHAGEADDGISADSSSDDYDLQPSCGIEKTDECGDLTEFSSTPLDLSSMNFSFKNLSQLASINQDVLLQSGKERSLCSSPCKGLYP